MEGPNSRAGRPDTGARRLALAWLVLTVCGLAVLYIGNGGSGRADLAATTGPVPSYTGFDNGVFTDHVNWLDTGGKTINAHNGGVIFADGRYHWYGMALRPLSVKQGGQKTTAGAVIYSSADLYNWTDEGVILACSTDPADPPCGPLRFERPKIVYNDRTKQFVLWCHSVARPGDHGTKPGSGEADVATCATVNGRYAFRGTTRPVNVRGMVRDCTLYKDDGSAYLICDRDVRAQGPDFGRMLHVVKLADDYLTPTSTVYKIPNAERREAPVVVKRNGYS
jgi:hypothetical protein